MSGLRSDISGLCPALGRIYPGYVGYVWLGGQICPVKQEYALWKSRSGAKTMNLGLNKLTTCKLNTIELREIKGTTRSNLNSRNQM
jgi:hypothetical protein